MSLWLLFTITFYFGTLYTLSSDCIWYDNDNWCIPMMVNATTNMLRWYDSKTKMFYANGMMIMMMMIITTTFNSDDDYDNDDVSDMIMIIDVYKWWLTWLQCICYDDMIVKLKCFNWWLTYDVQFRWWLRQWWCIWYDNDNWCIQMMVNVTTMYMLRWYDSKTKMF
jgi:hypothetical protein